MWIIQIFQTNFLLIKKFEKKPLIIPEKIANILNLKILKTTEDTIIFIEIVNNENNKNLIIPNMKSFPFNLFLLNVSKLLK